MKLRATILSVAMFIGASVRASGPPPNNPDLRYLARVLVVRVAVDTSFHRVPGANVIKQVKAALDDTFEAGGVIVPRIGKDPPAEAGRVPWHTFLFHVQTAVSPGSPGVMAVAYQAELIEYIPYPVNALPLSAATLPIVLWREASAQLVPIGSEPQLAQLVQAAATASASRCLKSISHGRKQAHAPR